MPARYVGEWRFSSTSLDLGIGWWLVVSFTPLPLYSRGKSPRYTQDGRLGGPQGRSGRCGKENNIAPTGN
jgi:hypothetical protein